MLLGIAAVGDSIGLVRQKTLMGLFHVSDIALQAFPPVEAIHTGLSILFVVCVFLNLVHAYHYDIRVNQAAKGVTGSEDTVVNLLESIELFLKRLDIYEDPAYTCDGRDSNENSGRGSLHPCSCHKRAEGGTSE